jgi:hypothetical protein
MVGKTVCRLHGGKSLAGLAHPSLRHGRYSKDLPARLVARYEDARTDPQLASVREEIGLVEARLHELLQRLDDGDPGPQWGKLAQAWKAYRRAVEVGDDLTAMAAQTLLDEGLEAGAHECLLWQEVSKKIEQLRQWRQTEHRRLVEMEQLITAERAHVLLGALLAVMQQAVTTHAEPCTARAILTALSTGVRVLATRPDHHNPASGGSG